MNQFMIYALTLIVFFSSCSKEQETSVELDAPVIYSISPQEARPGSIVTIEGDNFSRLRVDNKVLFNGVEAEIIHFNQTTMHVRAPQGSNDGPVTVTIAGKSSEGPMFYFIQPPAPTGETVVVKVLSFGGHATANQTANNHLTYYANLAKTLDVDFIIARELDSMTNRSGPTDRPKVLAEGSGLEHYAFARALLHQNGYLGIGVYSKYPITERFDLALGENRVVSAIQVQLTSQSQIAIAGIQVNDVYGANATAIANNQTLRNGQATQADAALNDVMVPLIFGGGLFMSGPEPLEDPMFKIFNQNGFIPGCSSCTFTARSNNRDIIADFISYRWAREARVIKYETLNTAPGSDRKPVYAEIEFKL